jgi:hypothetical protein
MSKIFHQLKIACLAWGSLVWDPRGLPVLEPWSGDGPDAPIEFTRQSNDGRITLVIDRDAKPVPLLWAPIKSSGIENAQRALCFREGITTKNWRSLIGLWQPGQPNPIEIPRLSRWATDRDLNAVIWTALRPRFNEEERSPSLSEVVTYLRGLTGSRRNRAQEYVEKAPRQIDTNYRSKIEAELGWIKDK